MSVRYCAQRAGLEPPPFFSLGLSVPLVDRCDLGRWLYGTGRVRLGHYPAFDMLVARHKYFHQQAADVVTAFQSGDQPKAAQLLNGSCRHASNQVLLLLKELKRGLGR